MRAGTLRALRGAMIACLMLGLGYGCGDGGTEPSGGDELVSMDARIVRPVSDTTLRLGDSLGIAVSGGEGVDSCVVTVGGEVVWRGQGMAPSLSRRMGRVGRYELRVQVWMGGQSKGLWRSVLVLAKEPPSPYGYKRIGREPHDVKAYTQGLLLADGYLYESTGMRGESELRRVERPSGKVMASVPLPAEHFGEGLAKLGDTLYQLTWTSGICHLYDFKSLKHVGERSYAGQGWGLESDGRALLMSDGTENIYRLEPGTLRTLATLQVYDNKGPIRNLNELELVEGLLYANVYMTDRIVAIDTSTGAVVRSLDLTGLLPEGDRTPSTEVLNGIAYDGARRELLLTGKRWPYLYRVQAVKQ